MKAKNCAFAVIALILNILIVAATGFGMFLSFKAAIDGNKNVLETFKYFTDDSNIFLGLAALMMIPNNIVKIKNPEKPYIALFKNLKFVAAVTTTLTLAVVYGYLGPKLGFMKMVFGGSNINEMITNSFFYLHTVAPILGIISVIFDKDNKAKYKVATYGFIPLVIYTIPYIVFAVVPALSDKYGGDWYKFLEFDVIKSNELLNMILKCAIVVAIMLVLGLIIGTILWALSLIGTSSSEKKERVSYSYVGEEPVKEETKAEEKPVEEPATEEKVEETTQEEKVAEPTPIEEQVEESVEEETQPVEEDQPIEVEEDQPEEVEEVEPEEKIEESIEEKDETEEEQVEETPVEEQVEEEPKEETEAEEKPVEEKKVYPFQKKKEKKGFAKKAEEEKAKDSSEEDKPAEKKATPAKKTAQKKAPAKKAETTKTTKTTSNKSKPEGGTKVADKKKEAPKKEAPKKAAAPAKKAEAPAKKAEPKKAATTAKKAEPKKEAPKKAPAKKEEPAKFNGKARVYHISQHENGYKVKLAGGEKAIKTFKTQKEAIDYAKELVKTQGGTYLIHSLDGSIRKG